MMPMKQNNSHEKILEKALRLFDEGVSPASIMSLYPDAREELEDMFGMVKWISAEKDGIAPRPEMLRKALAQMQVREMPAPQPAVPSSSSARAPLPAAKGMGSQLSPYFSSARRLIADFNYAALRPYAPAGAVLLLVLVVGFSQGWLFRKSAPSQTPTQTQSSQSADAPTLFSAPNGTGAADSAAGSGGVQPSGSAGASATSPLRMMAPMSALKAQPSSPSAAAVDALSQAADAEMSPASGSDAGTGTPGGTAGAEMQLTADDQAIIDSMTNYDAASAAVSASSCGALVASAKDLEQQFIAAEDSYASVVAKDSRQMNANQLAHDQQAASARVDADSLKAAAFAQLEASSSPAAAAAFEKALNAASLAQRSKADSLLKEFRSKLSQVEQGRQASVEGLISNFRSSLQAAVKSASDACASGGSFSQAKTDYDAAIRSMRQTVKDGSGVLIVAGQAVPLLLSDYQQKISAVQASFAASLQKAQADFAATAKKR